MLGAPQDVAGPELEKTTLGYVMGNQKDGSEDFADEAIRFSSVTALTPVYYMLGYR